MTPVEWPLRLIPRRPPTFLEGLAVSLLAVAVAVLVRGVLVGWPQTLGLSGTYFPAIMVATVYGGVRWGWATLAAALALGLANPAGFPQGVYAPGLYVAFALSGAVTVTVAGALRHVLLHLEQARRAQEITQEALDRSEARLRLAQDAGGVGLWDWDVATGDGIWSPTLHRNLGLDPVRDANVRSLLDMVHPEDREKVRQGNITAVKEGRMDPIEYRVIWPDGSIHWLLSRGEMLRDDEGTIVRAVGVNIDVTERRMAFEQVRESEARFRALADSAPVLLWVSKTDGQREFVNQAYAAFLGATDEQSLRFDWRERLHPEDLPRIMDEQVAGEAARELFTLEARYSTVEGAWRWIRSFSQPRYGPQGDFIGFIGIAFDVTDAKQAETDLKRINELLAETVQAALAERDEAEAALRHAQKLEAVGQLAGGVAHDFNNVLQTITGFSDLLVQTHRPSDAAYKDIMHIKSAANRAAGLVSNLLGFSRKQTQQVAVLNLGESITDITPILKTALGEKIELKITSERDLWYVRADNNQIFNVVLNLARNARDAMPNGGRLAIRTRNVTERESQRMSNVVGFQPGEYVLIEVSDTGTGMSPEVMAKIFEPFFTTKGVGKGTGLGLASGYGIVKQSGGYIQPESENGKGAGWVAGVGASARRGRTR